jgi:hypothetical protein
MYPHCDVAGFFHPEHCNVLRSSGARGIVMWANKNIKGALEWLQDISKSGVYYISATWCFLSQHMASIPSNSAEMYSQTV